MKIKIRNLQIASFSFLSIPYIFFALGWLKPVLALLLISVVLVGLFYSLKHTTVDNSQSLNVSSTTVVLTSGLFVAWMFLSGSGGHGFQNTDYIKHNAIFSDLISKSWPVGYSDGKSLVYYVAYYLPAAALGKLVGWNVANQFLFVWTAAGFALSIFWFLVLVGRDKVSVVLVFLFAGNLGLLGDLLLERHFYSMGNHMEWWAWPWQYSSQTTLLFWVPQHALCGWIATAVLIQKIKEKSGTASTGFLVALTSLWSPFITIGLAPYALLDAIRNKKVSLTLQDFVCAPIILFFAVLFLMARSGAIPYGWTWNTPDFHVGRLIVFELFSFGFYALFSEDKGPSEILSLVCLAIIPFFQMGEYNDFCMRVSIPSLFILWIMVARNITKPQKSFRTIILSILVLIGSWSGLSELSRSIVNSSHIENVVDLHEVYGASTQYFGRPDSFFFKYLAKR